MSIDISNTCRFCMASGSQTDLVPIFEDTNLSGLTGFSIIGKLEAINIMVPVKNDLLPQLICNNCIDELDQAYQFKEKTLNSESVLRSALLQAPALMAVDIKIETDMSPSKTEATPETPTDLALLSEVMIKIEEGCQLEVTALEVPKRKASKTTVAKMDANLNLKFPCLLCNREFATKKYLNRHITRLHLNGKLKASRKERLLEKHYNIPVPEKQPACRTPAETVPFKFHHRIGCPFCGMMFTNQVAYDKHCITYHSDAKTEAIVPEGVASAPKNDLMGSLYICHYDAHKFGSRKQLRRHMKNMHRGKTGWFKCRRANCGEGFSSRNDLERHRREHDELLAKQVYTCDICKATLKSLSTMKAHMDFIHKGSRDFLCSECGKAFGTKCGLKQHLITHLPDKQFSCEICGREFSNKHSLLKHIDTHKGLKLYRCEYPGCTAKYSAPQTLTKHKRVHTGETPYECDFCQKKFRARTHMVVHRRIHTNERPYKCPYPGCNKAFNQKHDNTLHYRVHTGVKPHICPLCQMAFRQPSTLKTHIKGVHKNHTESILN